MSRQADSRLRNAGESEPKTRKKQAGQAEWRGFINVSLSPAQKAQFVDWYQTGEAWLVLDEAVAAGCVIAVKPDTNSPGSMASCTQRDPASVNAGLCITARSAQPGTALGRLLFLVMVVGVEADWAAIHPPADPDRW